jgi:protein gp37
MGRHVDWVIVGGESGSHARPMHPDWARSLRDQCAAAGVPFLFKQWGEWLPATRHDDLTLTLTFNDSNHTGPVNPKWQHIDGASLAMVGKKAAGRLLDGRTHDEFPKGAA